MHLLFHRPRPVPDGCPRRSKRRERAAKSGRCGPLFGAVELYGADSAQYAEVRGLWRWPLLSSAAEARTKMYPYRRALPTFPAYSKPGVCRICGEPYTKTSPGQKVCPKLECRKEAKRRIDSRSAGKKRDGRAADLSSSHTRVEAKKQRKSAADLTQLGYRAGEADNKI